jgi:hypothetical protein
MPARAMPTVLRILLVTMSPFIFNQGHQRSVALQRCIGLRCGRSGDSERPCMVVLLRLAGNPPWRA